MAVNAIEHAPANLADTDPTMPTLCVCGSSMEWVECWECGGDGRIEGDELVALDPLWYTADDWETCEECWGKGGWWRCVSQPWEED